MKTITSYVALWLILLVIHFSSCSDNPNPGITSFTVYYSDSTRTDSVECEISDTSYSDQSITGWIPANVSREKLYTHFVYNGIDSSAFMDFTKVVPLDIAGKTYQISIQSFNKVPIVSVDTKGIFITDRENYIAGNITIDGNTDSINNYVISIRGRGNTTWVYPWEPKNPYKVKFVDKVTPFGFPPDKEFALIANWFDKSLLRNDVAMELSERLQRDWTPQRETVDMFLNGKYNGSYLWMETVKQSKDRVNIDNKNGGWLVEENHNAADDPKLRFYIGDTSLSMPADIKEGTVKVAEVKKQIDTFLFALVAKQYDSVTGYKKYFDLDSYVTWFLVNEIMLNQDASFQNSVYIQRNNGTGKIKMGPCWDFDRSSGNKVDPAFDDVGNTWRLPRAPLIGRLIWDDPEFKSALKKKWIDYKPLMFSMPDYISSKGLRIKLSGIYDANYFGALNYHISSNPNPTGFMSEVTFLSDWMKRRVNWIDSAINTF